MSCTILWRTTSLALSRMKARPSIPVSTCSMLTSPDLPPSRSIWVTSPVMTTLEPKPMRVSNIFICSGLEGLHGEGHGEVGLARARRPDAEGDDVGRDGVGVALLPARLGSDDPSPSRLEDVGGEHLGRPLVGLHHLDGPTDVARVEWMA